LRARFSSVTVVLVTAPLEVLAQRLAARGRASDGDLVKRIARSEMVSAQADADVVIANIGTPEAAAMRLLEVVRDRNYRV
jgi:ribose 1,5-bisphosphokinase